MHGDIGLHEYTFTFTADLISSSLVSMQNGKTCASDFVVKGMLAHLDKLALETMAELFGKRMRGQVDAPKSWKQLVSITLPEKNSPSSTSHLRPICILPVVKKFYLSYLRLLEAASEEDVLKHSWISTPLASRRGLAHHQVCHR